MCANSGADNLSARRHTPPGCRTAQSNHCRPNNSSAKSICETEGASILWPAIERTRNGESFPPFVPAGAPGVDAISLLPLLPPVKKEPALSPVPLLFTGGNGAVWGTKKVGVFFSQESTERTEFLWNVPVGVLRVDAISPLTLLPPVKKSRAFLLFPRRLGAG